MSNHFSSLLFWQLVHGLGPPCLQEKLSSASSRCMYSLRKPKSMEVPLCSTSAHLSSLLPSCSILNFSFGTLFLPLSYLALHCLHLPLLLTLSSWMTSLLMVSHLNYSWLVLPVFFLFFSVFFSSTLVFSSLSSPSLIDQRKAP